MTSLDDAVADRSSLIPLTGLRNVNEVHLVGKLSQRLQKRDLPSGDELGRWNLVVARPRQVDSAGDGNAAGQPSTDAAPRRRQSHDTIECVTFDPEIIGRLVDVAPGARLEVYGALRRRFRRDQPGQSQYGVEAFAVAVLATPPPAVTEPPAPADPAGSVTGDDPWQPVVVR